MASDRNLRGLIDDLETQAAPGRVTQVQIQVEGVPHAGTIRMKPRGGRNLLACPEGAAALAHGGTGCQLRSHGVVKYRPRVAGETATVDENLSAEIETTA